MTNLDALHAHTQEHHRIVSGILRFFARDVAHAPYPFVCDMFREGDPHITAAFWGRLNRLHPGRFSGVYWCHGCRRFGLHENTH